MALRARRPTRSLLALLALAVAAPVPGAAARPAPRGFVAVVDPGHGGEKDGAIGVAGTREKDLALQIARRVASHLRRKGGVVYLTRDRDVGVPLAQRAAVANAEGADLFLSIHLNAMPGPGRVAARGVETYFLSADATDASATAVAARENADRLAGEDLAPHDTVSAILQDLADADALAESSRLAHAIHERVVARAGTPDRGVKQAPFFVLAGARMPAVLLELGFLSDSREERQLATAAHQEQLARGVAEGIDAWLRRR